MIKLCKLPLPFSINKKNIKHSQWYEMGPKTGQGNKITCVNYKYIIIDDR